MFTTNFLLLPARRASLVLIVLTLWCSLASAQITKNNSRLSLPNSHLHRSYEAPVFILGHLGVGGGFQYSAGQLNYGASLVFRPSSAENFLDLFNKLDSAMVLRMDYQSLTATTRMFSGDFIVRHYLAEQGTEQMQVLPFFGLGLGASDVTLTAGEGGGSSRNLSLLAEVGQEWYFRPNVLLIARGQYRRYSFGDVLVSTWSVSAAVGIPVPW